MSKKGNARQQSGGVSDPNLYYWGKYKMINDIPTKIWIGPMTYSDMKEFDDTYRHNSRSTKPRDGAIIVTVEKK